MKVCSIPGCDRRHEAKRLCSKHYQAEVRRRNGDPDYKPVPFVARGCKIPGCGNKHDAKGYCSTHYSTLQKYGDPLYNAHEARERQKWVGDLRACSCCGEFKDKDNFNVKTKNPERLVASCKKCFSDKGKLRTREDYRRSRLKTKYNLTPEEWQTMFETQGGVCAICKQPPDKGKPFHVDHDHKTSRVRGLLCGCCNVAIGMLQDSPAVAQAATDYLKRTGSDSGTK